MNKKNYENFLLILGFIAFGTVIFYISSPWLSTPSPFPELVITRHIVTEIDVPKNEIFDLMSDVNNYPKIFPENFLSVEIINQTDNIIFTKEIIKYTNVPRTLVVKHTINPQNSHIVEIIEGDLRGTVITMVFNADNSTNLTTDFLWTKGIQKGIIPNPQKSIIIDMEIHFNEIIMTPGAIPKSDYSIENEKIPKGGYIILAEKIIEKFVEFSKSHK